MKTLTMMRLIVVAFLSMWISAAMAIVNPQVSEQELPEWMATIYVVNELALMQRKICHGSLIDARWVVSSAECERDPMHLLPEDIWDNDLTHYKIRIGDSSTLHAVKSTTESDDGELLLFELETPSAAQAIAINHDSYTSVWNTPIAIFGSSESVSIWHSALNPDGENPIYCEVDGAMFTTSGYYCYLVSRPQASEQALVANGIVVNPDDISTQKYPVDENRSFASDGSRLYLDFRSSQSHTCFEDLGAPVVAGEADSEELVGVVINVAPYLCSSTLYSNHYARIAHYKDFIDAAMADDIFQSMCPEAPSIAMEKTGGNSIRLYWDAVEGASGYKLLVSERLGYEPLIELDFGNTTEVSADIEPDVDYSVKLIAYNSNCTSPVSDLLTVHLNE